MPGKLPSAVSGHCTFLHVLSALYNGKTQYHVIVDKIHSTYFYLTNSEKFDDALHHVDETLRHGKAHINLISYQE